MRKTIFKTGILCLSAFYLVGCASGDVQKESIVTFSNINDQETRQVTEKILKDSGISQIRRQVFFERLDQFNTSVDPSFLTTGFEKAKSNELKYDPYTMKEQWEKNHADFLGYNCRLSAFELFADFVSADAPKDLDTEELVFDFSSLDKDQSDVNTKKDRDTFTSLYAAIKTDPTKNISTHVKNLKNEWKKRNVSFKTSDQIRLISVVFHDQITEDENELFIGHTGLLFPQKDGTLYFLEKVSFQEPYRIDRFNDRAELNHYLMDKYANDFNQETAKPFIMENEKLMSV